MRLIKNPETPWTEWELAVIRWFHSRYSGVIWNEVDMSSIFMLVNTGVQILVGEIRIFGLEYVDQFEIGSMCHLIDDTSDSLG